MCRPDDFPPYSERDAALLESGEGPGDGPLPEGGVDLSRHFMYRTLDPDEEQRFRTWARENWTPGQPVNPLWHPVVRDECQRIEQEARIDS